VSEVRIDAMVTGADVFSPSAADFCFVWRSYGNRPQWFQWSGPDYESSGQEFESLRASQL